MTEYEKQLEEHIKNLNDVIEKLHAKNEYLLYYIVPTDDYTFCIETNKVFFKTLEDVFLSWSSTALSDGYTDPQRLTVRAENSDYALKSLHTLKKRFSIYSINIMTEERKKVWG